MANLFLARSTQLPLRGQAGMPVLLFSVSRFVCPLARCLYQSVCRSRPCRGQTLHLQEAAGHASCVGQRAGHRDRRSSRPLYTRAQCHDAGAFPNHCVRVDDADGEWQNPVGGRSVSLRQTPTAAARELSLNQMSSVKPQSEKQSPGRIFCA
jgi:hypothetical protein